MANATSTVSSTASGITLLNEPGPIFETSPGAGGNFVASVSAPGQTTILEAVFHADNTAVTAWNTITLDANGNATIPVHFDQAGEYLNLANVTTLANTISFPAVFGTTTTVATPGQTLTITGGAIEATLSAPVTVEQTGGLSTLNSSAGHMSVVATGGSQVIFGGAGDNLIGEGPSTLFVGTPGSGPSTITASSGGSDTIFAGGPLVYNGAAGLHSTLIGGTGVVSVVSAANEVIFGGTGGGSYQPGSGQFFFIGEGGADTITGGAAPATIYGNANESLTIANTAPKSGIVALGDNDSINASTAGGGNAFYIINQSLPGGGSFSGNTTLVASSAGGDVMAMFAGSGAAPTAHTITIENWQASDAIIFGGYSTADIQTANAALATTAPGGVQFTLSDNTTVNFVSSHPTGVFG